MLVLKRDGRHEQFSLSKIKRSLSNCFENCNSKLPSYILSEIEEKLESLTKETGDELLNADTIQDTIAKVLMIHGYYEPLKSYIIYREKHNKASYYLNDFYERYIIDKQDFIAKYKTSQNTAAATVDDNSNVSNKNVGILNNELHKNDNIRISRAMVMKKLREIFPKFSARQYVDDLESRIIYKHDESSSPALLPYCCSITMYPFLNEGIKEIGGLSAKPKNLDSFCGMYVNLIFATSALFAGAVATSEFLVYFDYFARKEFGNDYRDHSLEFYKLGPELRDLIRKSDKPFKNFMTIDDLTHCDFGDEKLNKLRDKLVRNSTRRASNKELKDWYNSCLNSKGEFVWGPMKLGDGSRTIQSQIEQYFQQVVYSINQPAAARGLQSAFVNFSYFDKPFFEGMFGDFYFPNGEQPIWDSLNWLQKKFMIWFNKERLNCILTFPVESFALVYRDGKFLDQESADFVAAEYSRGHSFFTYISDSVDSLSSCCRLKNMIQTREFNFTNGNMGVQTGSKSVITLNLSRIIQNFCRRHNKSEFGTEFPSYLNRILERIYKYHTAYNEIMWDMYDANLLPVYKAGFIDLNKQYLTIGINGLNQGAEFLGIKCSDNQDYADFCKLIFSTIKDANTRHNDSKSKHKLTFNTECVPAESLAIKNYNWDKADGYWVPTDTNLYASYIFKPNEEVSILEKLRLHGNNYIGSYLDGGAAAHINLSEHLSEEQYKKILKYAATVGCSYFTFNVPNSECQDCGYITKHPISKCPKCGSEHISLYDRVIGYLTKIANWSPGRQLEQKTRVYSGKSDKGNEDI